jgi:hypothetical protein
LDKNHISPPVAGLLLFYIQNARVMKYIEQYLQWKEAYQPDLEEIRIPGSRIIITNMVYQSRPSLGPLTGGFTGDDHIHQNVLFRYPVLLPEGRKKYDRVIVFLHGLNERTWNKHFAGAAYLAEKTGKAVIMFPLSYHINRGLPEWTDARRLAGQLALRKQQHPLVREASIANFALSDRLTSFPERFLISGVQSGADIIRLFSDIQNGLHPLFAPRTKTDVFAYSISCLLMQTIMTINPGNLLERSKIVFFAGGSLFSHMHGISRYIMDSVAFETIRKYYLGISGTLAAIPEEMRAWLSDSAYGKAFRSIIAPEVRKNERERNLAPYKDRLMVIALRDDKVIPVEGIREATGDKFFRNKNFRIVHFPYAYSHENPFPVLNRKMDDQVEQAFHSVYNPALHFLAG